MLAHNELHGCSGASVRLSAIIHSFWKQSLSALGYKMSQMQTHAHTEPAKYQTRCEIQTLKVMLKKCLHTSRAAWAAVKF